MYTVRVAPASRGTPVHELTYFSVNAYPVGAVVTVAVRGSPVPAVVLSSEAVRASKAELRSSSFTLQKLARQKHTLTLLPEFVRAIERTAAHYVTTPGALFHLFLPRALLARGAAPTLAEATHPRLRGFIVPRIYQGLGRSRVEFYRTSVREAFAAGGSVFIVAPTVADVDRVRDALESGIERYTYALHGSMRSALQTERIDAILENPHPVLCIMTPAFLSLPRHDLATLIIEREGSSLYRSRTGSLADPRTLVHHLARELGGQLFLADLPTRIESIYQRESGEYEEVVTGHHRMQFPTEARLVSLAGVPREPKQPFRALGTELRSAMKEVVHRGGRVFLYAARRGLSSLTLCGDCGTTVTCKECGAAVVLHRGGEENYFLCHSCGALRHARERCAACTSWRLESFGIGAELIERELRETIPRHVPVSLITSDTARSHATAQRMVRDFYATPGSILVGTELALPYLTTGIPLVGVVSLDSLLSLAHWNIYERIATILTRLRELAEETLILQTRHPDRDILTTVMAGNFSAFYRSELRMRKTLGYPPYTTIIKISAVGKDPSEVEQRMREAYDTLQPYDLVPFSRVLTAPKGGCMLHGFIRVARDTWPDHELLTKLYTLSPRYRIVVDPDSIL